VKQAPEAGTGCHRGAAAAAPAQDGLAPPTLYWAMLVIACGICLSVLDATLVSVALPTIARELQVEASVSVWVINAYQITILVSILPLATLGDKVGYRRIYRSGMLVFVIASVGCAMADSVTGLGIARAVQGLGAAGIMSVNAALVRLIYPRARLGRGIALNAFVVAGATAAGPTIAAGILAVADWRWLFIINVPLGLTTLAGAMKYLPASTKSPAPFDLSSAGLSVLTFGLVFLGIDSLGHLDFSARTFLVLGAGLLVGTVFLRRQNRLPLPLLPVDLLRIPVFALSMGTSICSFAAQMIAMISVPFFLQRTLGHSAVETGLLMTPWPLALMVVAPLSGRLLDRYPAGALGGVGLAIFAGGLVALALLPADPGVLDVSWRMAMCGVGFGLFQSPNNHTILTTAPPHRSGGASGMLGTARLTGQTIGATVAALSFALAPGRNWIALCIGAALAGSGAVLSTLRVSARARRSPASGTTRSSIND
jgi:DHA2 family multidrug resistance protein-like MFS transporter